MDVFMKQKTFASHDDGRGCKAMPTRERNELFFVFKWTYNVCHLLQFLRPYYTPSVPNPANHIDLPHTRTNTPIAMKGLREDVRLRGHVVTLISTSWKLIYYKQKKKGKWSHPA